MSDNLDPIELQFIINSPELLAEFQKIIASGGDVDKALSEMKQKYEEVKKTQKDTGKETTSLSEMMKKLGGDVVMSGGNIDVLTGSLGDFAGEVVDSGNGIKILTKIKEGWLWITGGLTRGIMALGVAEGVATVASQVLMATITLGLSVAIAGLIVLLTKMQREQQATAEAVKKFKDTVADTAADSIVSFRQMQAEWNSLGNSLTEKQKYIDENQKLFEKLGISIKDVNTAEKVFGAQAEYIKNAFMERAKAAAASQLAVEEYKNQLKQIAEIKAFDEKQKNDMNAKSHKAVAEFFGYLPTEEDVKKSEENVNKWIKISNKAKEAEQNSFKKAGVNPSGDTKSLSPVLQAMEKDDEFLQARFGSENAQYVNHHKELLQKKIKFYADDKKEAAKYAQELRLFEAAQYKRADDDAKKAADERLKNAEAARKKALAKQQQYDNDVQNLKDRVSKKETTLYNKENSDTSAKAKINTEFDALEKEAKRLKVNSELWDKIKLLRAAYLDVADEEEKTTKLLKDLDNQRELYQAFETLKTKISETEASKRLGINYSEFQTYGQVLDEEIKKLTDKAKRSVEENARLKELQDRKTSYTTDEKQQDTNKFAEAYQATITYREQLESINKTYDARALQLQTISDENLRKAKLAENEKQRQEAINSANAEAYEKSVIFQRLSDNLLNITKRELGIKITALKKFLATAKNLTPEQKEKITNDLQYLQNLQAQTNIGVYQNALLQRRIDIQKALNNNQKKSIEQEIDLQEELAKVNEELGKMVVLKAQMFSDSASQLANAFQDMSSAIGDSNEGLSAALETAGDLLNVAGQAANAFAQFASGNIVGGITSTIQAIAGIFNIGKKRREAERKANEEIKRREAEALQAQLDYNAALRQRLLDEVKLNDLYKSRVDNIKEELEARKKGAADNLRDQQAIFNKLLGMDTVVGQKLVKKGSGLLAALGGALFGGRKKVLVDINESISSLLGVGQGAIITDDLFKKLEEINAKKPLTGDAKTAYDQLVKIRDEYGSIADAQRELETQLKDAVTGTTAQNLADSIREGLKSGKKSFADFADDIEGFLRDAVLAGISAKVIEPEIQKLQDALAEMMGDGILSADERKTFQDMYMKIVASSQEYMDMINQAGVNISTSTSSANSLSGAIKGMSQESADVLGGQLGGMRLAQLEGNQILKTGFAGMMEQTSKMVQLQIDIEKNTRKTAENTEKLYDVNDNVEKVVDGQDKYYKALQAAGIIK